MRETKYVVSHSNGMTWVVEEQVHWGSFFIIQKRRYFATEEEARAFKAKKEAEEQ